MSDGFNTKNIQNAFENIQKDLEKKAQNVSGQYDLSEVFTDEFMKTNTSLNTLDEFLKINSIFSIEDYDNKPVEELDICVRNISNFNSYEDMLAQAAEELISRNWDL